MVARTKATKEPPSLERLASSIESEAHGVASLATGLDEMQGSSLDQEGWIAAAIIEKLVTLSADLAKDAKTMLAAVKATPKKGVA